MKIKELLEGLTFKGYPCTSDCSGHQAGWEYAVHWGLEPDQCPYGSSNSFWEGCKSRGEEEQDIGESVIGGSDLVDVYLRGQHRGETFSKLIAREFPNQQIPALIKKLADKYGINPNAIVYGPSRSVKENFADGKVKGKSRPGRVKRAGASCSGSVSELRARAKKYGGERGRMYHWCANMKSGKKK